VIEKPLRAVAIVASLFVIGGWIGFGMDETRSASEQTRAEIAGTRAAQQVTPTPSEERARERTHSAAREMIDDVNDVLLRPFAFVTDSSPSEWLRRSVSAILALVVYGFGLAYVARFTRAI
jgi:hypothetical protein